VTTLSRSIDTAFRPREVPFEPVRVAKVDDRLGVVFGLAIVSKVAGEPYFDLQDHHVPEDVLLKAAVDFMAGDRPSLYRHEGEPIGRVLFAWPAVADVNKAMGVAPDATGLWVGVKVDDAATLKKFRDGTLTGFSIGGMADLEDAA
jgi:hypothetical protein